MNTLRDKIQEDLKDALRSKESERVSVLRMLYGAVRNKEIALRKGEDVILSDEQILDVISSELKKRKDSIEAFEQAGRNDLADKEKAELGFLQAYLPEQLTDEAIELKVRHTLESSGGSLNFGALMGKVIQEVKGKADGGRVGAIVKKVLEG